MKSIRSYDRFVFTLAIHTWEYGLYVKTGIRVRYTPKPLRTRLTFCCVLLWCDTFDFIARRHWHVFRMALHNEGNWRMETWKRARRASCHVSIRQSPSCVMPFWTHAKCILAFISYLPMWIKAKYTFIKTVYSPRFYGGPYFQAKHADICSGVLFWTACTRRPHVLSLPSRCEKSDSWRQSGSVKTAKKSRTVPQCGHVTLNCLLMASKQAKVEFSSHIFHLTRLHGVAVMQGLTFWDSVVTLFKSARWYVLSGTGFLVAHQLLEMWCANAKLANQVLTSHVKTLVIRMSWSYRRCFEWQER